MWAWDTEMSAESHVCELESVNQKVKRNDKKKRQVYGQQICLLLYLWKSS